jgi:hypothetical protein
VRANRTEHDSKVALFESISPSLPNQLWHITPDHFLLSEHQYNGREVCFFKNIYYKFKIQILIFDARIRKGIWDITVMDLE